MGCGLASLDDIEKGTIIIKQKTEMGFVSGNGILDGNLQSSQYELSPEDKDLNELGGKIETITRKVAQTVFQGNAVHENRLYQHLILTQKLIMFDRIGLRKDDQPSSLKEFMKVYADILPR
jgi:hypothetical protein